MFKKIIYKKYAKGRRFTHLLRRSANTAQDSYLSFYLRGFGAAAKLIAQRILSQNINLFITKIYLRGFGAAAKLVAQRNLSQNINSL